MQSSKPFCSSRGSEVPTFVSHTASEHRGEDFRFKMLRKDIKGQKFGRWTVVSRAPNRLNVIVWNCVCECGTQKAVLSRNLINGTSKSCGCLTGHGYSDSNTYRSWCGMIKRCYRKTLSSYKYYGGRGITVCERWRKSFVNFLKDMGECPPGLTIERKDSNGNYEPDNCRWATHYEQARNRSSNRIIEFEGQKYILSDLANKVGIWKNTLAQRLDSGWPLEKALSTPVQVQKKVRK